jgi:hypothetical protein
VQRRGVDRGLGPRPERGQLGRTARPRDRHLRPAWTAHPRVREHDQPRERLPCRAAQCRSALPTSTTWCTSSPAAAAPDTGSASPTQPDAGACLGPPARRWRGQEPASARSVRCPDDTSSRSTAPPARRPPVRSLVSYHVSRSRGTSPPRSAESSLGACLGQEAPTAGTGNDRPPRELGVPSRDGSGRHALSGPIPGRAGTDGANERGASRGAKSLLSVPARRTDG